MIITNNSGLPQPIVDAVIRDPYSTSGSDISVTRLIQPPRKIALEKRHADELTEDAADRIWALTGQIGHQILERAANVGIIERRFYMPISGWTVSGQCDIMELRTLLDYKFTSVWTVKDGLKPEWEQQLNLLALLSRYNGFDITEAQIVAIFRDWSVMEAKRDQTYPQKQVMMIRVPLLPQDLAMEFAQQRVSLHQAAQQGNLPECTSEERWEKPTKWAVMKNGMKRAVRLYDSEQEAIVHAASAKNLSVEHRPGESIRCANYCSAAPFCDQWKTNSTINEVHSQQQLHSDVLPLR